MKKSRVFITGDIHGERDFDRLGPERFKEGMGLSKNDYVIIAGDFGCLKTGGEEEKKLLDWLDERPFTTLFVDGNHENFTLLNSYNVDLWNGGKVHRITDSAIHLMRGQVFEISDRKIFTFGGAASPNKDELIENVSWWKEELCSKDEICESNLNLERHNWSVDYVISHTASTSMLDELMLMRGYKMVTSVVTDHLEDVYRNLDFKRWYFGHFHLDVSILSNVSVVYNSFYELVDE